MIKLHEPFEIFSVQRLLPIGSVVKIKGVDVKMVITSNLMKRDIDGKEDEKVWEYMANIYPFGVKNNEDFWYFNTEDITDIYFVGYADDDYNKSALEHCMLAGAKLHIE